MDAETEARVRALADSWERRARIAARRDVPAQERRDAAGVGRQPTGAQFIWHGAMTLANCARDLRKALQASSLPPSPAPSEPRSRRCGQESSHAP